MQVSILGNCQSTFRTNLKVQNSRWCLLVKMRRSNAVKVILRYSALAFHMRLSRTLLFGLSGNEQARALKSHPLSLYMKLLSSNIFQQYTFVLILFLKAQADQELSPLVHCGRSCRCHQIFHEGSGQKARCWIRCTCPPCFSTDP